MTILVAGLVLFLGIHILPMLPGVRNRIVASAGEKPYKLAFSAISALGLVLIVIGYARAPATPRLFDPFPGAIALAPFFMAISFVLLAAANMKTHIRRALKHPMLIGLGIWATVHLLANGHQGHAPVRRLPRVCGDRHHFRLGAPRGQAVHAGCTAGHHRDRSGRLAGALRRTELGADLGATCCAADGS